MTQRLAAVLAAMIVCGFAQTTGPQSARADGFCNCCLDPMPGACGSACASRQNAPGQCQAFVIYEGAGARGPGGNPLNAMSLKELDLGKPSRPQLEEFRRFVEKYRRKAIEDWRAALRAFNRGKLSKDAFEKATSLYRESLVGYYHSISAYRANIYAAPE